MSGAVSALAGVVVGGFISAGTQWLLALQQARRDLRREAARFNLEMKTALRLVADEVDSLGLEFAELLKRGHSLKTPFAQMPHYLPVAEWEKSKTILAIGVDDHTWTQLSALYYSVKSLRSKFSSEPPATPLDERHIQMLKECVEGVEGLRTLLQPATLIPVDRHP